MCSQVTSTGGCLGAQSPDLTKATQRKYLVLVFLIILMLLFTGQRKRNSTALKGTSTGGLVRKRRNLILGTLRIYPIGQGYHQILMQLLSGAMERVNNTCSSSRVPSTG